MRIINSLVTTFPFLKIEAVPAQTESAAPIEETPAAPVPPVLSIASLLEDKGFRAVCNGFPFPDSVRKLAAFIAGHIEVLNELMCSIRHQVQATGIFEISHSTSSTEEDDVIAEFLRQLQSAGVLEGGIARAKSFFRFTLADLPMVHDFLWGKWLEQVAYDAACEVIKDFGDAEVLLNVKGVKDDVSCFEADVLLRIGEELFALECKSGKYLHLEGTHFIENLLGKNHVMLVASAVDYINTEAVAFFHQIPVSNAGNIADELKRMIRSALQPDSLTA